MDSLLHICRNRMCVVTYYIDGRSEKSLHTNDANIMAPGMTVGYVDYSNGEMIEHHQTETKTKKISLDEQCFCVAFGANGTAHRYCTTCIQKKQKQQQQQPASTYCGKNKSMAGCFCIEFPSGRDNICPSCMPGRT